MRNPSEVETVTVDAPTGLPEPREIRALAAHLKTLYPVESYRGLIDRKDYDGAHQLSGALDVIDALEEIALGLEEAAAEQTLTATFSQEDPGLPSGQ